MSFERKDAILEADDQAPDGQAVDDPKDFSQIIISRGREKIDFVGSAQATVAPLGVDLRLLLAVDKVLPTTVDIPRGSRADRKAPLLITEKDGEGDGSGSGGKSTKSNFILDIHESTADRSDWAMTATLIDNTSDSNGNKKAFVVLSQEPFSLLRFFRAPLSEQGDPETSIVAEYSSAQRTWQFKNARSYRYTFPAQVVGEGADKPRRNEIYDVDKQEYLDKHLPYPVDGDGNQLANSTFLLDYRLPPPTDLWVKPSDLERNYFLPEWSAYEIFRQKGDFGLGAALQGFRGEFLYGLSVGVDTSKEAGPASEARVAEIEALTGDIVGEVDDKSLVYEPVKKRWRWLTNALRSRPERLEAWVENPSSKKPFGPARFSTGASFALRKTALHRPPVPGHEDPEGCTDPKFLSDNGPRFHEQGLSGGALWPLESRNFFERLLENPQASGGSIERVALSPLGGDADQTAEFLNGNVKIISQTRNGRVQRQRIEIMGRVCALWHRAKHVVVYERTVNASEQFAPRQNAGTRTRRPVLRKVSEYVELLEPMRSYPDFPGVSPKTNSCFDSVRFNSKIIHVDSAWSQDVGKVGWKIPLWNRYAARTSPRVYPLPDVGFTTVAQGKGERPLITQGCKDPENIYFYAECTDNPDTDSWAPRCGNDFCNAVHSCELLDAQNRTAQEPGDFDSPRAANASRTLPGYRRFTWHLFPAGRKTRINAERGQKPIYADLESVTFMRAQMKTSAEVSDETAKTNIKNVIDLVDCSNELARMLDTNSPPGWTRDIAPPETEDERAAFQALLDELVQNTPDKEKVKEKFESLSPFYDSGNPENLANLLFGSGSDVAKHFNKFQGKFIELHDKGKEFLEKVGNFDSKCSKIADEAVGNIRRKKQLILENIRDFQHSLSTQDDLFSGLTSKAQLIDSVVAELGKLLDVLLDHPRADLGNLKTGLETVRAVIADYEADIDSASRRAQTRITQLFASYDQAKPWSDARMDELIAKLSNELSGLGGDIQTSIAEARQRFATELDSTSQRIGAIAARLLNDVANAKFGALMQLKTGNVAAHGALGKASSAVNKATDGLAKLKAKVEKANKKNQRPIYEDTLKWIESAEQKASDIQELIDSLDKLVKGSVQLLRIIVPEVANKAGEFIIDVNKALIKNAEVVNELASDLSDEAAEEIKHIQKQVSEQLASYKAWAKNIANRSLEYVGDILQPIQNWLYEELNAALKTAGTISNKVFGQLDGIVAQMQGQIDHLQSIFASESGKPSILANAVAEAAFRPAVETVLSGVSQDDVRNDLARVIAALQSLADEASERIDNLEGGILDGVSQLQGACSALDFKLDKVEEFLKRRATYYKSELNKILAASKLKKLVDEFGGTIEEAKQIASELKSLNTDIIDTYNDAVTTVDHALAYSDRVLDHAANLAEGGFGAAPSNVLRLYSAATSAPELALLQSNIDRMRIAFREGEDFLRSSKAKALLARLGDSLKAMGLDLPFDRLGDQFQLDDQTIGGLDIGKAFRNFGGMKLNHLFKGVKLPADINKYVRISHDFDQKAARAWVQVDVNVPLRGSRTLFEIGPFKANFLNSTLRGQVRLEASKDTDRVQETGDAVIATAIELQVSGQAMVTLEDVSLRFSKESGMDFKFNPKKIRLNEVFRFIQDTLGALFPDEFGGMKVVKQNGIPVGLEHDFTMPPVSLNFATSGVSNIAISNNFKLLAYPDFVLADRFNLSRVEQPFLFSIFIIGGTGYIQIDTEYRPFDQRLSVAVEAAAGGSAALAFAFGPVAGMVFITLSTSLQYRKVFGQPSGGLSVSLVLVICGIVSVWGIVNIMLFLTLRMTYHENGKIDAIGSLSVEVRVTRFFKMDFRTMVTYQLRGGKTTKTVETKTKGEIAPELRKKAKRLQALRS